MWKYYTRALCRFIRRSQVSTFPISDVTVGHKKSIISLTLSKWHQTHQNGKRRARVGDREEESTLQIKPKRLWDHIPTILCGVT